MQHGCPASVCKIMVEAKNIFWILFFCLASSEFLWPDSIPLCSNYFRKFGPNCLMLQLKVGVICCTLSNNIYLSAQSAVPKNQCGWEKLWGVDHLTSTGTLVPNQWGWCWFSCWEWLIGGSVIGLIWHCSRSDSDNRTEETAVQDEEWIMCALVSHRKEHNLPLE